MMDISRLLLAGFLVSTSTHAQNPVIDVHVHASLPTMNGPIPSFVCVPVIPGLPAPTSAKAWPRQLMHATQNPSCADPIPTPETPAAMLKAVIGELEQNNAVGILSGPPGMVNEWKAAAPERFIKSLQLNVMRDPYTAEQAREYFQDGGFLVLGEVSNQYIGVAPNHEKMMPFWAMAEELNIPVQIHMGSGPPGAAALYPDYRLAHGNPLLLEPVLAKHPGLRISVMHMAEGFNDELIMMLWTYPQIYIDIGGIMWGKGTELFYRQLKNVVDAGFGNRVMFGADAMNWPGLISRSVQIVEEADFLTAEQKQDIFFNNAVRFFGLDAAETKRRALGQEAAQ